MQLNSLRSIGWLIINVSLSTSYNSIDPNASSCIGCSLQVIASSFCFHNKCTMGSSTFWCIQMIQIYFIDGLVKWLKNKKKFLLIDLDLIHDINMFRRRQYDGRRVTFKMLKQLNSIYRKICTASWFSFRFIWIVNQCHFLSIEHEPSSRPSMKCGTQFVQITVTIIIFFFLIYISNVQCF